MDVGTKYPNKPQKDNSSGFEIIDNTKPHVINTVQEPNIEMPQYHHTDHSVAQPSPCSVVTRSKAKVVNASPILMILVLYT